MPLRLEPIPAFAAEQVAELDRDGEGIAAAGVPGFGASDPGDCAR